MHAHPLLLRTPLAVLRLDAAPADWRRVRLRSPSRPPVVSVGLWRELVGLAAVGRHRRAGRPAWAEAAAADTVPPGEPDTVPPPPPKHFAEVSC